jgi:hypothetical protein
MLTTFGALLVSKSPERVLPTATGGGVAFSISVNVKVS